MVNNKPTMTPTFNMSVVDSTRHGGFPVDDMSSSLELNDGNFQSHNYY